MNRLLNKLMDGAIKEIPKMFVTSLFYTDLYQQYRKINDYLYKLQTEKYNKNRSAGTRTWYHELTAGSKYAIVFDRLNFMVVSTDQKFAGTNDVRMIRLDFVGPKRYAYKERFIKNAFRQDNRISTRTCRNTGSDIFMDVLPRNFDSIVMSPEDKLKIISGVTNWKNSKSWYLKHQLPYKLGILLYGSPGTGKSSIARAVSHILGNCDIMTISPGEGGIMEAISTIITENLETKVPVIVLLEDIDMLFYDTNREIDSDPIDDRAKSSMSYRRMEEQRVLFQLLDGILSFDGMVVIATTNYYKRLDEGLIRPGRFPIQVEVHNFDRAMALEMVKNFGMTEEFLDGLNLTYPVQPAYLQDLIIENKAKEAKI